MAALQQGQQQAARQQVTRQQAVQQQAAQKLAGQKEMQRLLRRMRGLKNEMDLLEILSNFWPLPNMESRVDRLEKEMDSLNKLYLANRHLLRR